MDLGEQLTNPSQEVAKSPKEATQSEQKSYLGKIKSKNKNYLIKLSKEERERVGKEIMRLYNDALPSHKELCNKLDMWDEISRIVRSEVQGSDGNLPNYRMPLSTVSHEVMHANIMNVFFTPADIMRCLPTAQDDIEKVNSITTFGNWSLKNELDIFNGCDRLFHSSTKNGESVAMIYWKREYGVEIKRKPKTDEKGDVLYDKDTEQMLYDEIEESKCLYDAPYMEVIPRKDYIQSEDAIMGEMPSGEGRYVRMSYDDYLREELEGKMYTDSIDEIKQWPNNPKPEISKETYDGEEMPIGKWKKEFVEWYCRLRIKCIKEELTEQETAETYELEDEFIALVHVETGALCSLRKNKFPMKKRPFVNDYFIPDDTGRRAALGVYELMEPIQRAYDALFNEFINAVDMSNKPIIFFTPTGNMRDERFKIQRGFAYPTNDPKSVNLFQFPSPNDAIKLGMEIVQQWAQYLFGISDYAAGMESSIDPSAPAKKAQIVVEQGNVRLNMIIKRKNATLKEIFLRWFLLYRDNMPANKFMRIAGEGDDPWKFEAITYEDFALQSIPDFDLCGNVLNANKQLEFNKKLGIYQMLVSNPLFNPQGGREALQALMGLTKWFVDGTDEIGLTAFLPQLKPGHLVHTPEEENAYFLQGQEVDVQPGEDHVHHIKVHMGFMNNPEIPEEIKPLIGEHIKQHVKMMKEDMNRQMTQQMQAQNAPSPKMFQGQESGVPGGINEQAGRFGKTPQAGGLPQQQQPSLG